MKPSSNCSVAYFMLMWKIMITLLFINTSRLRITNKHPACKTLLNTYCIKFLGKWCCVFFELPFETNGNQPEAPFDDIVMHSHREGKSAVVFLLSYRNCYHLFLAYGDLPFLKSSWIIPTGQGREWHGTKTLWHHLHRNSNGDSVILTMICWSTVLYIYTTHYTSSCSSTI